MHTFSCNFLSSPLFIGVLNVYCLLIFMGGSHLSNDSVIPAKQLKENWTKKWMKGKSQYHTDYIWVLHIMKSSSSKGPPCFSLAIRPCHSGHLHNNAIYSSRSAIIPAWSTNIPGYRKGMLLCGYDIGIYCRTCVAHMTDKDCAPVNIACHDIGEQDI